MGILDIMRNINYIQQTTPGTTGYAQAQPAQPTEQKSKIKGFLSGLGNIVADNAPSIAKIIAGATIKNPWQQEAVAKSLDAETERNDRLRQAYKAAKEREQNNYMQQAKEQLAQQWKQKEYADKKEQQSFENDLKNKNFEQIQKEYLNKLAKQNTDILRQAELDKIAEEQRKITNDLNERKLKLEQDKLQFSKDEAANKIPEEKLTETQKMDMAIIKNMVEKGQISPEEQALLEEHIKNGGDLGALDKSWYSYIPFINTKYHIQDKNKLKKNSMKNIDIGDIQ